MDHTQFTNKLNHQDRLNDDCAATQDILSTLETFDQVYQRFHENSKLGHKEAWSTLSQLNLVLIKLRSHTDRLHSTSRMWSGQAEYACHLTTDSQLVEKCQERACAYFELYRRCRWSLLVQTEIACVLLEKLIEEEVKGLQSTKEVEELLSHWQEILLVAVRQNEKDVEGGRLDAASLRVNLCRKELDRRTATQSPEITQDENTDVN